MIKKCSLLIPVVLLMSLSACDKTSDQTTSQSAPAEAETAKADDTNLQAHIETSRTAMKALGSALKAELKAAMGQGGPIQALDVCHTKAPELAAMVSAEQGEGVYVGRTSLKRRNSNNAPTDWQSAVLNEFQNRKAAGEDASKIEFSQVVSVEGGKEFRYMKAIPAGEVCLKCHGAEIDPMVKEKINSLYPDDQATGYQLGDIRGAFVVTKPL